MRPPSNLMKNAPMPDTAPAPATVEPGPPANYLDFYGLSKPPFDKASPSVGYLVFTSHRRAFERLTDHLVNGAGVVLVQGEEGIGKTETLLSAATVAAKTGLRTIMVSRPSNGRLSLPQLTSALLGQPSDGHATTHDAIAHFLAPPRKALLIDDVDLLPPECLSLLLSLAQRAPRDPGGPALIMSVSASDITRPELSELAGLARDTIRLVRLSPAEVRQYIERALWITGGTTRRLFTPDAMKRLVARSGGVPIMINRLVDAAFTAGFARGDAMITGKTVAAAMGPTAPRARHRANAPPSRVGHIVTICAIGILVLGASAFLYRGLTRLPPQTMPTPAAVVPTAPEVKTAPEPLPGVDTLSGDLIAALVKRGDQSLGLGDIGAARLLYQRAAVAGSPAAATALGKTYDPSYAGTGGKPDPERAERWYRYAISLGDPQATDLLNHLLGH